MGGEVRVAVRYADGSVRGGTGWTSILPGLVLNERFLDDDEAYLRDALDAWDDGDAAGTPPFAPHGYGIVVVDVPSRTVVTCNEFSSLVEIPIQPRAHVERRLGGGDARNGDRLLARLLAGGRLSVLRDPYPAEREAGLRPVQETLVCTPDGLDEAVRTHFARMPQDDAYSDTLVVDLHPWKVLRVHPTELVSELVRLGLPMSEAGRKAVDAWMDEDLGDDDEEA